nr:MAG TPA: hypothetical protein [Caudoviricetes sp.]
MSYRVEPACTGPPVFYTQESPQLSIFKKIMSKIRFANYF